MFYVAIYLKSLVIHSGEKEIKKSKEQKRMQMISYKKKNKRQYQRKKEKQRRGRRKRQKKKKKKQERKKKQKKRKKIPTKEKSISYESSNALEMMKSPIFHSISSLINTFTPLISLSILF
jgi:hypothetical protein